VNSVAESIIFEKTHCNEQEKGRSSEMYKLNLNNVEKYHFPLEKRVQKPEEKKLNYITSD